jgi:hypothetical protein
MRTRESMLALIQELEGDVTELLTAFPRVHRSFVAKLRSIADAL